MIKEDIISVNLVSKEIKYDIYTNLKIKRLF